MPIPETQLDTWSHQGSITQSANTYNAIKDVLEAEGTPFANRSFKVFLQGSYGNDTNVYAESDVDVVIRLDDIFQSDLSELNEDAKARYRAAYVDATYTYPDFKRDVFKALQKQYGNDAKIGDKAIAIAANSGRRKADVIVAMEFRRYWQFNGLYDQNYTTGVCFYNADGTRIANYPKQHSSNLTARHQQANAWLKPMIRVVKNMRRKLVADGVIESKVAPSYYLEGLMYNIPPELFIDTYENCFVNAFNWLQAADKSQLLCANEQYYLLRDGVHTCWPTGNGAAFIAAARKLWTDW